MYFVYRSVDGGIRTYDLRKGEVRCDQMGQPVTSVSLSNDGHIFLVSCLPSVLRLIDKDDGTMYKEYTGHTNKEYQLDNAFHEMTRTSFLDPRMDLSTFGVLRRVM